MTGSPGPRSTGRGSPVSMDSSTGDHPVTTVPSRGRASPGRTRTSAPTGTLSGATSSPSSSSGSATTRAVGGRSERRECMARAARARARASIGPPGDQDGHDERGHHPVQPGGEGPAASQVDVAAAEGDGLDGADRQRGQGARGRSACPCWWRRGGAAGRCPAGRASPRRSRPRRPGPARSSRPRPSPVRPGPRPGRPGPGATRWPPGPPSGRGRCRSPPGRSPTTGAAV